MRYTLGIDVSTTATKALLMDEFGEVVAVAAETYDFETPLPLWSEQHPALWWQGTVNSIQQVIADSGINPMSIAGIGLTGQMHGLVLLDEKGKVLRDAILWNDQRTQKECDWIREQVGEKRLIKLTGNNALTGFTAPKLLWVRENEPEIYDRIKQVLLPKDYVRFCLTDLYATDKAGAAGTLLMDVTNRTWSHEVLEKIAVNPEWLPSSFEGPEVTGVLSKKAAALTGLAVGTPVVAGGGDQAAQAVGVGAVEEGIVALTLGTSGVVFATTDQPFIEPEGRLHAFCHAVPDKWHLMGVMLSAAGSLQWYRDTIAPELGFNELLKSAEQIPAGSDGLRFLPYLTGERTPYPDPYARGAFIGLTVRHTLAHMTRAVLEGVAFGLKDGFDLMCQVGLGEINQVRMSGGGSRSVLWRQILADILDVELVRVNTTEGAAYGAALLAGVGTGIWIDVKEACLASVKVITDTSPRLEFAAQYRDHYETFQEMYPLLKDIFPRLK